MLPEVAKEWGKGSNLAWHEDDGNVVKPPLILISQQRLMVSFCRRAASPVVAGLSLRTCCGWGQPRSVPEVAEARRVGFRFHGIFALRGEFLA